MQEIAAYPQLPVKALLLDYDGTISPLEVSRVESKVSAQMQDVLKRISRKIPVVIVTSKAPDFIVPRTPFATAWSTVNGLETRIGNQVFCVSLTRQQLESVQVGLKLAKTKLAVAAVEVEEKRLSNNQVVGFCIDWRCSPNPAKAKKAASRLAQGLRALSLYTCGFERDPFYDVYPVPAHKGQAVEVICRRLGLNEGVAFMGDSEMDNPAFLQSSVSFGVVNPESRSELNIDYCTRFEDIAASIHLNRTRRITFQDSRRRLRCDYYVRFDDVSEFLDDLWKNGLVFDPGFSSVTVA